ITRLKVKADINSTELSDRQQEKLLATMKDLINQVRSNKLEPTVYRLEDEVIDYTPIRFLQYKDYDMQAYDTFNEAVDEVYSPKELTKIHDQTSVDSKPTSNSRAKRLLERQEGQISKLEAKAEKYTRWGELVFRYLPQISNLVHVIKQAREKKMSWEDIISRLETGRKNQLSELAIYESVKPSSGTLTVQLDGEKIELDIRLSPTENAQSFYKLAKKTANKVKGAKRALEKAKIKAEHAKAATDLTGDKDQTSPTIIRVARKAPKKAWYHRFHWFFSSEDLLIVAGRDLKSNELLFSRYLEPDDLFLHGEIQGAPVTIIKEGQTKATENTVREAAQFAASYSSAWKRKIGTLDVYYVTPDQVSKSPQSGEYLAKGSYIVKGKRGYVKNVPLRLAIGFLNDDQGSRFIVGPPAAVAHKTPYYVDIIPGDNSSHQIAKMIHAKIKDKIPKEWHTILNSIPLYEIQNLIPSGGATLA
ncbi:MAG: ribosome rescue protein RqcH, partial [Candidatus Ranarchaeia archaeon]